uniref:Uncharacterized protein n=1 Tax=Derbesia sp. WEST4838 TaxID=1847751 RepID=A0A1C9JBA7_9CHLO|nr:hypothetical protein [Derbesia sp. WEST4838]AOP19133.1 hypothetical protein [Derbesia sp. WEST4838]
MTNTIINNMNILYKIIPSIATICLYIICVSICFFKPLMRSNIYKGQNQQDNQIDKQSIDNTHTEYKSLLEEIQLLKQRKKHYQQQVRTLREEIRWSNDRLLLQKWGKDVTELDKYRKKLEDEWNRALQDEDDSDKDDK